jgi:putative tricarboxylic transport membrane protein
MSDLYLQSLLAALAPENLLFVFIGALLGTLIGMLPGVGSVAGIAMLLPLTYNMEPTTALIMLAGIYYGCEYGGSTTSILLRTPGEGGNAISCLDGYEIARNGKPRLALATAAISSFIAGITAALALMLLTEPLTRLAVRLAPPEYFAITVFALILTGTLASRSLARGVAMIALGLLIATIGMDAQTSLNRFTFGSTALMDGVPFIVAASGLFALSELMFEANRKDGGQKRISVKTGIWLTWADLKRIVPAALRGSGIGFLVGIMPGAGGIAATFLSYSVEKNLSKNPENFGKGEIEGLASPEAANNAAAQGSMLPLFTLGIPGSATGAVLLGAFMLYGLQPGPTLMARNPEIVWTIVTSMIVGNMILLLMNFPLVPLFAKLLDIPRAILFAVVAMFVVMSVYSIRGEMMDIILLAVFGAGGYILRRMDYPVAPILMGMVLGDILEKSFRRSLAISLGDPLIFVTRPVSATILGLAAVFLTYKLVQAMRAKRRRKLEHA